MKKIIVFTDTHMQLQVETGKLDPDVQLAKGLAHVNQNHADADLVVFCGDLTDKGDIASYQKLKARLKDLELPYQLLLGNHDNRENFLAVFPDAIRDEHGFVQRVIETENVNLIMLDTLYGPPYEYPMSHMGNLCEKRFSWLEARLAEAGSRPCIIFMHHPPNDTGFAGMDAIKLMEGERFHDVISKSGNVVQLVCGHVHRTISGCHRGTAFCVFKSTVGQMPMLLDDNRTYLEVNEPSAYGIVMPNRKGVTVHTEDFELGEPLC